MSGADDAASVAERRKLEAELADAKSDLNDKYYDHAKDAQSNALDQEAEAYEKSMNKFVEGLRTSLDTALKDMDAFMKGVLDAVTLNAPTIIEEYNKLGLSLDDAIINPWTAASEAIKDFQDGDGTNLGLTAMNAWIGEGGIFPTFQTNATTALTSPWGEGTGAANAFVGSVQGAMQQVVKDVNDNVATASGKLRELYQQIETTQKKINNITTTTQPCSKCGHYPCTCAADAAAKKAAAKKAAQDYIDSHNMLEGDRARWGQDPGFLKLYQAYADLDGELSDLKGKTETIKGFPLKVVGTTSAQISVGSEEYVKKNTYKMGKIEYYYNASDGAYYRLDELKKSTGSRNPGYIIPKGTQKYKYYAKGTLGTKKDEWAITDESWIGEEITLAAGKNGQLQYLKKGSAVMPADISANLIEWGKLDPNMMDLTNPTANINMINNAVSKPEFKFDIENFLRCDNVSQDTLPELKKFVNEQMNSFMRQLNYGLKKSGAR